MTTSPTPRTRNQMVTAARRYRKAGLSFIPIQADGTKCPAFQLLPHAGTNRYGNPKRSWKPFQQRRPTVDEIRDWFGQADQKNGIAIVGGEVSGGLEVIDLDSYKLVAPWTAEVEKRCPGLVDRLVWVRTPRPGMHVYYRCKIAGGNAKLARIRSRQSKDDQWKPKTVIEVKGEGGYVLAPPSPPTCHPRNRPYVFEGDLNLIQVPTITPEEREALFAAARALDTWEAHVRKTHQQQARLSRTQTSASVPGGRPGDDFNARASWSDILCPHGWQLVGGDGVVDYWRRPGKNIGTSATTNYEGSDLLFVWSTNADPFEAYDPDDERSRPYTKFAAYALLEHFGDFETAASELRALGYGANGRARANPYSGSRLARSGSTNPYIHNAERR